MNYMKQFNKSKIVELRKVGDFYETYGEQAIEVGNLLNIRVTSKIRPNGIALTHQTGFPNYALKNYKEQLERNGYTVIITDERLNDWRN